MRVAILTFVLALAAAGCGSSEPAEQQAAEAPPAPPAAVVEPPSTTRLGQAGRARAARLRRRHARARWRADRLRDRRRARDGCLRRAGGQADRDVRRRTTSTATSWCSECDASCSTRTAGSSGTACGCRCAPTAARGTSTPTTYAWCGATRESLVDLSERQLVLYRAGEPFITAPVAVGAPEHADAHRAGTT